MRPLIAAAIAAFALPAAAQTVTVAYKDQTAMAASGYEISDYHQERMDHWRGEIDAKSAELQARMESLARSEATLDPEMRQLSQDRIKELGEHLDELRRKAKADTEALADNAMAEFRRKAGWAFRDFARTNGIGEILVDVRDDDGPSFVVLNPAFDISARIGEMVKSGPGAEVASGPDRPPVIRYVKARDVYRLSGHKASREAGLSAAWLAQEDRFFADRQVIDRRTANLEQRRVLMGPEDQALEELRIEAEYRKMAAAYEEALVLLGQRIDEQLSSFKNDLYIYLANNPGEVKADIVRFIDDDALAGTLMVPHPDLDITDLVTARMRLPE